MPAAGTNGTRFDGVLHRQRDPGYEAARLDAVWNERKPDRHPAAILLARSDQDVAAGVVLARREGLSVSIRSGGHSWVGNGVRDGVLLIDLSQLQGIEVDAQARTAAVRPATRGPALLEALAEHGLFFPTGHASTVGIGGFSLGGGYGWNSRTFGPACLSIRAIDVVLADGTLIHADDDSHPDLLWAARGSGPGFFGIVTRFYFDAYPVHDRLLRSSYIYPPALRDEVFGWSLEHLEELPAAVEMSAKVGFSPGFDQPAVTLNAVAFCADGAGTELLSCLESAPFRRHAIRATVAAPMTMDGLYAAADGGTPRGWRYAVDGIWCDGPAEEIIAAAGPLLDVPSSNSFLLWMLWGHYPEVPSACWSTQAPLYLSPNAVWSDPADDLRHELWAHGALAQMASLSKGLQFSDNNLADRPDDGISPANQHRLEKIRAVFDPDNLFCTYMVPGESTTMLALTRRARQDA
jgi:FAD/FMN-containing dehydrogenase